LFGPTGIEPTISCILGEHANNYPTEVHNTNLKAGWIHALMRGKQFTEHITNWRIYDKKKTKKTNPT
jgi:hypothetical protein